MEKIRWCEISDFSEAQRMSALSETLSKAGIENEFSFVPASPTTLQVELKKAQKEFSQIRISGTLGQRALENYENVPIAAKLVGAIDAIVQESPGEWWPRNFLAEGLQRAIVSDVKTLNIGSTAFILGTGWEARSVVAALSRIGFRRFTISDHDEKGGDEFIRTLHRNHFDVEFQFIPRKMITQLPSVHSFGVNTLVKGRDEGVLEELVYFNYLEMGGVWLDLPLVPMNAALAEEADAAGAIVEPGIKVAVATDTLWAEACFQSSKLKFDSAAYHTLLAQALSQAPTHDLPHDLTDARRT
jgi:shikimate 5-dehydrogenase